jgi:hypothetical protein
MITRDSAPSPYKTGIGSSLLNTTGVSGSVLRCCDQGGYEGAPGAVVLAEQGDCCTRTTSTATYGPGVTLGYSGVFALGRGSCVVRTTREIMCCGDVPVRAQKTPACTGLGGSRALSLNQWIGFGTDGVEMMAAGPKHACLVSTAGQVRCFGQESHGGIGANGDSALPYDSPLGMSVARVLSFGSSPDGRVASLVSVGGDSSCALFQPNGLVRCWGAPVGAYDNTLEYGSAATPLSSAPYVAYSVANAVAEVTTSGAHHCVVFAAGGANAGRIICAGADLYGLGALGLGPTLLSVGLSSTNPISTAPLLAFSDTQQAVSVRTAPSPTPPVTCALFANQGLRCWGADGGPNTAPARSSRGSLGYEGAYVAQGGVGATAGAVASLPYISFSDGAFMAVDFDVSGVTTCGIFRPVPATITSLSLRCWGAGTARRLGRGASTSEADVGNPGWAGGSTPVSAEPYAPLAAMIGGGVRTFDIFPSAFPLAGSEPVTTSLRTPAWYLRTYRFLRFRNSASATQELYFSVAAVAPRLGNFTVPAWPYTPVVAGPYGPGLVTCTVWVSPDNTTWTQIRPTVIFTGVGSIAVNSPRLAMTAIPGSTLSISAPSLAGLLGRTKPECRLNDPTSDQMTMALDFSHTAPGAPVLCGPVPIITEDNTGDYSYSLPVYMRPGPGFSQISAGANITFLANIQVNFTGASLGAVNQRGGSVLTLTGAYFPVPTLLPAGATATPRCNFYVPTEELPDASAVGGVARNSGTSIAAVSTAATIVNSTALTCTSPSFAGLLPTSTSKLVFPVRGRVSVTYTGQGGASVSLPKPVFIYEDPVIDSVTPPAAPSSAPATITIAGVNFADTNVGGDANQLMAALPGSPADFVILLRCKYGPALALTYLAGVTVTPLTYSITTTLPALGPLAGGSWTGTATLELSFDGGATWTDPWGFSSFALVRPGQQSFGAPSVATPLTVLTNGTVIHVAGLGLPSGQLATTATCRFRDPSTPLAPSITTSVTASVPSFFTCAVPSSFTDTLVPAPNGVPAEVAVSLDDASGAPYVVVGTLVSYAPAVTAVVPLAASAQGAGTPSLGFITIMGSGFVNLTSAPLGDPAPLCRFAPSAALSGRVSSPAQPGFDALVTQATYVSDTTFLCRYPNGPLAGFPGSLAGEVVSLALAFVSGGSPEIVWALDTADVGITMTFFTVSTLVPSGGSVSGGTVVTVLGSQFPVPGFNVRGAWGGATAVPPPPPGWCIFTGLSTSKAAALTVVSPGLAVCSTPVQTYPGVTPTLVAVTFHDPAPVSSNLVFLPASQGSILSFVYHPDLAIGSLSSSYGAIGSPLTLSGSSFYSDFPGSRPGCLFGAGGATVVGTASGPVANIQLTCVVPAGFSAGASPLAMAVSMNGVDFPILPLAPVFRIVRVDSVYPAYGPLSATINSVIYLTGLNLDDTSGSILVGTFTALTPAIEILSNAFLKHVSPFPNAATIAAAAVVTFDIKFSRPGMVVPTPSVPGLTYTYYPIPSFSAATPVVLGSGHYITLAGTKFFTGGAPDSVMCRYAATVMTPGTVYSPTSMACQGPSHTAIGVAIPPATGAVVNTLEVSFNYGFNFHASVSVLIMIPRTIYPNFGVITGGTTIVLTGTKGITAQASSRCVVTAPGGAVSVVNATLHVPGAVKCVMPSIPGGGSTPGVATVELRWNNAVPLAQSSAGLEFFYHPAPSVTALDPVMSTAAGGTPVTVWGSGFNVQAPFGDLQSILCVFGSSYMAIDSTVGVVDTVAPEQYLVCLSSPGRGVSTFSLSVNTKDLTAPLPFSFYSLVDASPLTGPGSGGTLISVYGLGFTNSSTLACTFGGAANQAPAVFRSSTLVTCVSVAQSGPSVVTLGIMSTSGGGLYENPTLRYSYFPTPAVTAISPTSTPAGSAATVTVYGVNFINAGPLFRCRFGSADIPSSVVVLPWFYAVCPVTQGSGVVTVQVSFNAGSTYTNPSVLFSFLVVLDVSPSMGPNVGGTVVTISGAGFTVSPLARCRFNTALAPAVVQDAIVATCESAAAPGVTGPVPLRFSTDSVVFTNQPFTFTYYAVPLLTAVSPLYGPSTGNFPVTLFGWNLPVTTGTGTQCSFGESDDVVFAGPVSRMLNGTVLTVPSTTNSTPTFVVCVSPSKDAVQTVYLSFNGGSDVHIVSPASLSTVSYYSVVSISPASFPEGLPLTVTLSGTRLAAAPSGFCQFGTQSPASPAVAFSSLQISCTRPPLANGTYYVEYSAAGSAYTADLLQLVVYKAPLMTSVYPPAGLAAGNTRVTVRGSGFFRPLQDSDAQCRFGRIPTPVVAFLRAGGLAGQALPLEPVAGLVCLSPASVGQSGVDVSFNGGFAYTASGFTFNFFLVLGITPATGPTVGGSPILIEGSGFDPAFFSDPGAVCQFSQGYTSRLAYLSASQLRCVAPPMPAGEYGVSFSIPTGVTYPREASTLVFTTYEQRNFSSIEPLFGAAVGGTSVFFVNPVNATFPADTISCSFGAAVVVGSITSSSKGVRGLCISPLGSGVVPLAVSFNYVDFLPVGNFSYFAVSISSPVSGPVTGGTVVTVTGSGFLNTATLTCRFGQATVPGVYRTSNRVECVSPFFGATVTGAAIIHRFLNVTRPQIKVSGGVVIPGTNGTMKTPVVMAPSSAVYTASFEVGVSLDGSEYSLGPSLTFFLYDRVKITALSPPRSVVSGGEIISLWGTGFFSEAESLTCRFVEDGSVADPVATFVNDTLITCVSSPHADDPNVRVYALLNGQQVDAAIPTFGYFVCPRGTFAPGSKDPCIPCPPGFYADAPGSRECKRCPASSYAEFERSQQCTPCPVNSFIEVATRTKLSQCECQPAFYSPFRQPGTECLPCPLGAVCPGGSEDPPRGEPGYWTENSGQPGERVEVVFLKCDNEGACPGGQGSAVCATGYKGRLCSLCEDRYYPSGFECRVCPKSSVFTVVAFFVFVVLVCVMLFRLVGSDASAYGGTIGIATYFFQVLSVLSKVDLKWPVEVQSAMAIVSAPFSLNVDVLASECSVPGMDFPKKWSAMMLIPWLFGFLFGSVWLLSKIALGLRFVYRSIRGVSTERPPTLEGASLGDGLINAFSLLLALTYLTLISTSFQLFDCTLGLDGQASLDAEPSLVCYQRWWWKLFPAAVFGVVVYGVGTPLGLMFFLYRHRSRLETPVTLGRFGAIFVDYRTENYYWEIVMMAEKFFISLVLTFFTTFVRVQIIAFLLVNVMGLCGHIVTMPFFVNRYNKLQTILRWCACLMIIAGMLFLSGNFPTPGLRKAVIVFSLALIFMSIVFVVMVIIYDVVTIRRSLRNFNVGKEGLEAMAKITSPHGKTIVLDWMGSRVDEAVRTAFANSLVSIHRFSNSERFFLAVAAQGKAVGQLSGAIKARAAREAMERDEGARGPRGWLARWRIRKRQAHIDRVGAAAAAAAEAALENLDVDGGPLGAGAGSLDGKEILDRVMQRFTSSILIQPAVPAARMWILERIRTAKSTGNADSIRDIREFVRAFSEIERFRFFSVVAPTRVMRAGSSKVTLIPWLDDLEEAVAEAKRGGKVLVDVLGGAGDSSDGNDDDRALEEDNGTTNGGGGATTDGGGATTNGDDATTAAGGGGGGGGAREKVKVKKKKGGETKAADADASTAGDATTAPGLNGDDDSDTDSEKEQQQNGWFGWF